MMSRTPRIISLLVVFGTLHAASARAQSTRIEQNDPRVVFSGNWYTNTNAQDSGGLAALTNTKGARVSLTFTGTGVTWIGASDGWAGLGTVYLDGAMTVVDTYSDTTQFQRPLFTAQGLTPGLHSIAIEVTHERGP